jgi:hypothetical protein
VHLKNLKKELKNKGWRCGSALAYLPGMQEDLGLILSTEKKKNRKISLKKE